jgi:Phage major capsid protein E
MPHIQKVKFDRLMTNIAVEFAPEGYIANEVSPPVPVKLEDGTFWVYDKSKFSTPDAMRAPRTMYRRIDWEATRDNYHAEEYGLETVIDQRERNNSALPLDLDETSTEVLVTNLLNNRERRVANLVLATANVPQNVTLAGADQWSDAAGGDPIGVGLTAFDTMRGLTGVLPDSVVMGYSVWTKLQQNPKVRAELSEGEQISLERLARLWGVKNIYVGKVLVGTNKKGQTVTLGDVWGKHVLFFHKGQGRPALRRPAFSYQMRVQDLKTVRYHEDKINSDVIRVNEISGEKIVSSQLGYLIRNAVA